MMWKYHHGQRLKLLVRGGDEGGGKIFLNINRLKGWVLKMGEIQHKGFKKSRADEVENSDGDGKGRSDK